MVIDLRLAQHVFASIYTLVIKQTIIFYFSKHKKYNPNTINNTQNDKKPVSNAVLYKLEIYEKKHKYFIGTLLNEPDQNFGYHIGDTITFFLYGGDDDERALVSNMNEIMQSAILESQI